MPRTALVTGAAGAIGRAVGDALNAAGYALVLTDLAPRPGDIGDTPYFRGDLTDAATCRAAVALALARTGRLDALVNCAGASEIRPFLDQDEASWTRIRRINLDAAFLICQEAARAIGEGGAIVNVSSIAYRSGGANPAYGAAKAGLIALTYSMAQALGPKGVTVNAVAPGVIETQMVTGAMPPETFERLRRGVAKRTPLRRLGTPQDVAGTIAFLLSDQARFITGAVIPVTGGLELLPPLGSFAEDAS